MAAAVGDLSSIWSGDIYIEATVLDSYKFDASGRTSRLITLFKALGFIKGSAHRSMKQKIKQAQLNMTHKKKSVPKYSSIPLINYITTTSPISLIVHFIMNNELVSIQGREYRRYFRTLHEVSRNIKEACNQSFHECRISKLELF